MESGGSIPVGVIDGLLAASVVVVFLDRTYFERWYCLRELDTALKPYEILGRRGASHAQLEEALTTIVVALKGPPDEIVEVVDQLPPSLRTANAPASTDTPGIMRLLHARLGKSPPTLATRLAALGELESVRLTVLESAAIPPARALAGTRTYPSHGLPPSIQDEFVGRADDLWRIHWTLSAKPGDVLAAALTASLEGGGGFGKTRLALEYVHRFGPQNYRGGLFWLNADGTQEQVEQQHHGMLSALDPSTPDLATFRKNRRKAAAELAAALRGVVAGDGVLFVVDNVPEPAAGQRPPPLTTWCPVPGEVALLLTSRLMLSLSNRSVRPLPVRALAPEPALLLLTRGLSRSALDDLAWNSITQWVGCLPLALELLNRTLLAGGLGPADLLLLSRTVGTTTVLDAQMDALRPHVPAQSLRGITEAFEISYRRLSGQSQEAARLIAQLAPAPVPMALLDRLGDHVFTQEARAALRARSFVSSVHNDEVAIYGEMHRVLADFTRSKSDRPAAESMAVAEAVVQVMDPRASFDPGSWPIQAASEPHARHLFGLLRSGSLSQRSKARQLVVQLGLRLGSLALAQGLYTTARVYAETSRAIAVSTLGDEHVDMLAISDLLGRALMYEGKLEEAERLQVWLFEHCRARLGVGHYFTAWVANSLAMTRRTRGDLTGASELLEDAVETLRTAVGDGHPDTQMVENSLAETMAARGDLTRARSLQESLLRKLEAELGHDYRTFTAMQNLALTLLELHNNVEAEQLLTRAVRGLTETLGERHPETVKAKSNLAQLMLATGRPELGRPLVDQALAAQRATLQTEHPDTLTTMLTQAQILAESGDDLARAQALAEQVLAAQRSQLGLGHIDTATTEAIVAQMMFRQDKPAEATPLMEHALEVRRATFGIRNPLTAEAAWGLSCILSRYDFPASIAVLRTNLSWALSEDPRTLDPNVQSILAQLQQLLRDSPGR